MAEVQSDPASHGAETARPPTPSELALLFLRLGCTAFGGPAAHIAMMEDEVVQRRRWLSREKFLDLLGATNLIPGPNSTEMAIHVGMLAGWRGFLIAGACFILPAVIITGVLAWSYVSYGVLPEVAGILYGVKPVIIAVVLQALWKLGRESLKTPFLAVIAALAATASFVRIEELAILFGAGLVALAGRRLARRDQAITAIPPLGCMGFASCPWANAVAGGGVVATTAFGLWPLFLFFLKVGAVLFGSGYVLLAFLRADLVERRGWLTEGQLLDAVAVGQVTPGPVFSTATFIGYVLAGPAGAVVATVGIFVPAFFFVAVSGPLVRRIRRSRAAGAFLDGVIAASFALMGVVTWDLAGAALVDVTTILLAIASAILLFRFRVNSAYLVLGGAVVGMLASRWQG